MSDAHGNMIHEAYHTGLRNLHALETTAIELTGHPVEHIEQYSEPLRGALAEQQAMAKLLENQIKPTAVRYMDLVPAGDKARI